MFYFQRLKKRRKYQLLFILLFIFLAWIYLILNQENWDSKLDKVVRDIRVQVKSFFIPKTEEYSNDLINGINKELVEENQELKELLGFQLNNYRTILANVISRDIIWYQEIVIDKGEKEGIKPDMAVISHNGLIGKISKVSSSSSVVKLLTSNSSDMKIAVDIKTKSETIHGILNGYLKNESFICVDNISKDKDIQIGDMVYTNGLGGIYPSGIYIGKVMEVTYDSLGLNKMAKIRAPFSYDSLRYVAIIDRG